MPLAGSFAARSDYAKKQKTDPPTKSSTRVLRGGLKTPKKFNKAQVVPMNVSAIQAALTAANS